MTRFATEYRFEPLRGELGEQLRSSLAPHLRHELLGEMALDWAELIRRTAGGDHELVVYRILRGEELQGVAILMVVRGLDPEGYLWPWVARLLKPLVRFVVGFLEVPLLNMPGLLTAEGVTSRERASMLHALRRRVRADLDLDALMLKVDESFEPCGEEGGGKRLPQLRFYPNAQLEFPFGSFDECLAAWSSKKRRRFRKDRQALEALGGVIEVIEDISGVVDEVYALYTNTAREVAKRPHAIAMPVTIRREFFARIGEFPAMQARVIAIRIGGRMIADALLIQSGDTLFLKAIGMDYDLSHQSHAYFNLFYATLEYAASRGCKKIDFGVTSYAFKEWLGSALIPAAYLCDVSNPILSFGAGWLIRGIEERIGSAEYQTPSLS